VKPAPSRPWDTFRTGDEHRPVYMMLHEEQLRNITAATTGQQTQPAAAGGTGALNGRTTRTRRTTPSPTGWQSCALPATLGSSALTQKLSSIREPAAKQARRGVPPEVASGPQKHPKSQTRQARTARQRYSMPRAGLLGRRGGWRQGLSVYGRTTALIPSRAGWASGRRPGTRKAGASPRGRPAAAAPASTMGSRTCSCS
jgi:hypothetical protein